MLRKLIYAATIAYLVFMFTMTHLPKATVSEPVDAIGDKKLHLLAYAVLGFLLSLSLYSWGIRSFTGILWLMLLAGMCYAYLDEATQPTFGRDFELMDLVADYGGLLAGFTAFTIATLVLSFRSKTSSRESI